MTTRFFLAYAAAQLLVAVWPSKKSPVPGYIRRQSTSPCACLSVTFWIQSNATKSSILPWRATTSCASAFPTSRRSTGRWARRPRWTSRPSGSRRSNREIIGCRTNHCWRRGLGSPWWRRIPWQRSVTFSAMALVGFVVISWILTYQNSAYQGGSGRSPSLDCVEKGGRSSRTSQTSRSTTSPGWTRPRRSCRRSSSISATPNDFRSSVRAHRRGVLLVGPPGTGKTLLAKACRGGKPACRSSARRRPSL